MYYLHPDIHVQSKSLYRTRNFFFLFLSCIKVYRRKIFYLREDNQHNNKKFSNSDITYVSLYVIYFLEKKNGGRKKNRNINFYNFMKKNL